MKAWTDGTVDSVPPAVRPSLQDLPGDADGSGDMGPLDRDRGGVLTAAVRWVTELLQGDDAWDERLSEAMQRLAQRGAADADPMQQR